MFISKILNKFDNSTYSSIGDSKFHYKVGEVVNVGIRVCEAQKLRIQNYRGLIIAQKQSSFHRSLRIRKIFQKIGIEQVFPLQSLQLTNCKCIKQYQFRRSKLYYLRTNVRKSSMINS